MSTPDPQLTSSAVLEELRSSRNLMDAVIPDLPAAQPDRTRFALGSCQYPGGFIDEAVAYASYRDLAQRLAINIDVPRFVILTGDQVYTDATAGLFDPSMADGRYTLPYHRWLRSRAARTVLRQLHTFMMLDDHEIRNDWEEPIGGVEFDAAIKSYMKYQRGKASLPQRRDYAFRFDGFDFYMLDTRTRRAPRDLQHIESADLLDGQGGAGTQYDDLVDWDQMQPPDPDRPKFIVSSSMLLPRHRAAARWDALPSALHSDGWDGYPHSLHQMLVMVAKSSSKHIVFLSGDEHIGCIATITVKNHSSNTEKTFYSIHTPGLFTPYAFANGAAGDWLPETNRQFVVDSSMFSYTVTYTPYPGAGFAYISVEKAGGNWHLSCRFANGPVVPLF